MQLIASACRAWTAEVAASGFGVSAINERLAGRERAAGNPGGGELDETAEINYPR